MRDSRTLLIVHAIPVFAKDIPFYTLIPSRMGSMFGDSVNVRFIGICIGGPPSEATNAGFSSEWIQIDPNNYSWITAAHAKYKLLVGISNLCRKNRITVMNSMRHYDFFIIAGLARLFKSNAIVRVTGILPRDGKYGFAKRFRKFVAVLFERFTVQISSSAVVLSDDMANTLVRYGSDPAKICVVSQGIDTTKYWPKPRDLISRIPRNLLFVGRLNKLKGAEDAILAFIEIKQRYPLLKLTICGVGPEESELKIRYGSTKDLVFLGYVDNSNLPALYADNDILLLPSYSEGLPNVVLEAMVSRLFVIASRVGGITQLLDKDRGRVHEAGNIPELVLILVNVIENTDLRLKCTDNAYKYATAEHSFDAVRQKYLRMLNCHD